MQAKHSQLGAQGQPGDPEPAGGFRLIAPREANGLRDQLTIRGLMQQRMRVLQLARTRRGEQLADVAGERGRRRFAPGRASQGDAHDLDG